MEHNIKRFQNDINIRNYLRQEKTDKYGKTHINSICTPTGTAITLWA